MKTRDSRARRLPRAAAAALVAALLVGGAPAARASDAQAVADASARFYAALNALFTGDAAPMAQVWSHRDDITYMGPSGGYQVGWAQVGPVWDQQASLKLGGRIEPTGARTVLSGDIAVVSLVEVGENTNADGKPAQVSIRATNVFRRGDGVWKMIGHHTDLLPFLAAPQQVGSAR